MYKDQKPATTIEEPKSIMHKVSMVFMLFIGVLLTLSLIRNISTIILANQRISEEQAQLAKIEEENARLKAQLAEVDTSQFKEKQARDQLGFSKEGEVTVLLPPEELVRKLSPITKPQEEETVPQANWKRWVRLFIKSPS